jgi:glycerophosphoryl diester phosphodiesterase
VDGGRAALSPPLPRLLAHRGALRYAPENTLASLRAAARLGATWVEFDVQRSRDGRLFLLHDDGLERTTDGAGLAAAREWDELARLDAGRWFGAEFAGERLPGLEQVVALCEELHLGANVEIKAAGGNDEEVGRDVARAVGRLWPARLPPPLLSSFSDAALHAARAAEPGLRRALCVEGLPRDWWTRMRAVDAVSLHVDERPLTRPQAASVKARQVPLLAWTVNSAPRAAVLSSWGVDGFFTDRLDLLRRAT